MREDAIYQSPSHKAARKKPTLCWHTERAKESAPRATQTPTSMDNVNLPKDKRKGLNAFWLSSRLRAVEEKLERVCTLLQSRDRSQEQLLTREQAADRLSISTRTLDTLESEGEIRAIRIRGRVLYDPEALDAFIRACAKN